MKKIATILMLVAALLIGGISTDAKTTKKKKKAKAKTTASITWNGDIPSAEIVYSLDPTVSKYDSQFRNHGYSISSLIPADKTWEKPGVCKIWIACGSGGCGVEIEINNATQRNKLYNDLKQIFKSKGPYNIKGKYPVEMNGNTISF